MKDMDDLLDLSENLYELSNCGLGQTAGAPIRDNSESLSSGN